MKVDAHAHIFPRIRGQIADGPVLGREYGRATVGERSVQVLPPLNPRVVHTPSMLLAAMDLVGVDRAVLLQGPFYGYCNSYVGDAIARFRQRLWARLQWIPGRTDGGRSNKRTRRPSLRACSSSSSPSVRALQVCIGRRASTTGPLRGSGTNLRHGSWSWSSTWVTSGVLDTRPRQSKPSQSVIPRCE